MGDVAANTEGAALDPARLPPHQLRRWQGIVEVAGELLEADDYDTIQIRDVAARCGVALGTLYRYFPSKELLYATVLREWSAAELAQTSVIDPMLSAGERLRGRLHHSVRRFEQYPTYLRLEMLLQQSADPEVRRVFDEFTSQVTQAYLAQLFDVPDGEREDMVTVFTSALVHQLGLFGQGRQSIAEVRRLMDRLVDLVFGVQAVPDGER